MHVYIVCMDITKNSACQSLLSKEGDVVFFIITHSETNIIILCWASGNYHYDILFKRPCVYTIHVYIVFDVISYVLQGKVGINSYKNGGWVFGEGQICKVVIIFTYIYC